MIKPTNGKYYGQVTAYPVTPMATVRIVTPPLQDFVFRGNEIIEHANKRPE